MVMLTLVVLGLALAGPVQLNCAQAQSQIEVATPCADMAMDEGGTGQQQRPERPMKACAILMCPSTSPAMVAVVEGVRETTSHAVQHVIAPVRIMVSANPAPEQRPPIS